MNGTRTITTVTLRRRKRMTRDPENPEVLVAEKNLTEKTVKTNPFKMIHRNEEIIRGDSRETIFAKITKNEIGDMAAIDGHPKLRHLTKRTTGMSPPSAVVSIFVRSRGL